MDILQNKPKPLIYLKNGPVQKYSPQEQFNCITVDEKEHITIKIRPDAKALRQSGYTNVYTNFYEINQDYTILYIDKGNEVVPPSISFESVRAEYFRILRESGDSLAAVEAVYQQIQNRVKSY